MIWQQSKRCYKMAFSFLLAAKQGGKYNRQLKQVVQLNKNKYKPSVNTKTCNNLLQAHQTTNDLVHLHETAKKFIQPIDMRNTSFLTSMIQPKEAASNFVNHKPVINLPRLPEFLARQEIYCVEIFVKKRRFHTAASERKYSTENESQRETRRLPRIVYMQNPFTWIINKFDLKILEKAWDPTFCQTEFIRGTKQVGTYYLLPKVIVTRISFYLAVISSNKNFPWFYIKWFAHIIFMGFPLVSTHIICMYINNMYGASKLPSSWREWCRSLKIVASIRNSRQKKLCKFRDTKTHRFQRFCCFCIIVQIT